MTFTRKIVAVGQVALALALFLYARQFLKSSGFSAWQEPLFGAPILSSCLLFFVLPLILVLMSRRRPGSCGLTASDIGYHLRVAIRAIAFVLPATLLFPLIAMLGTDHKEWFGASILTVGFIVAGLLLANNSRDLANASEPDLSWKGLHVYIALLVIGVVVSYLLHPWSQLATRLIAVLIFVGFLEEFFFRGYVQSRLNSGFGKPYRFRDVQFGPGLLLAAAIFGLFHPLTVAGEMPWAWALWTAASGLVFGFLREKTGAVITPAMLHGALWIPGVFFGPG